MSNSPWEKLDCANHPGEFISQLVSPELNPRGHRIFWAKDAWNRPALLIEYRDSKRDLSLPIFKSISLLDDAQKRCLALVLEDGSTAELFLKVCLDIVGALQNVSDKSARKACILRLERWCSMLRAGRTKLSPEAQKGLIAELLFLIEDAAPAHGIEAALKGWTGPDGGKRDFAFGQTFVEVKSKRSSSSHEVIISSEEQLNVNAMEQLYLFVMELNGSPSDDSDTFSVTNVAQRAIELCESPLAEAELERKLGEIGFFFEDDYNDARWTEGERLFYQVADGFPRIDSSCCAPGVGNVTYHIDLDYCMNYQVDRALVDESLR